MILGEYHDVALRDFRATDAFYAFDATTVDDVFVLGSLEGDLDALGAGGIAELEDPSSLRVHLDRRYASGCCARAYAGPVWHSACTTASVLAEI